jgi:hypothetical protein
MLRRLLSRIVAGEITSLPECAAAFGVKPDTLDEMIARLVALGYIENASTSCASSLSAVGANSCGGACRGCAMACSCHGGAFAGRKGIAWQVTAKGRAAAAAADSASSGEAQEFRG